MSRERDVRNAIQAALIATGAFTDVWLSGPPQTYGRAASELLAALIEPSSTAMTTGWDAQPAGGLDYTATVTVTLLARHPDPQLRDEAAELLLDTLIDAVCGQSLAGITLPGKTLVTGWKWLAPEPPERRIAATVSFAYLVSSWGGFDTSP